jgi:hypothetical protein
MARTLSIEQSSNPVFGVAIVSVSGFSFYSFPRRNWNHAHPLLLPQLRLDRRRDEGSHRSKLAASPMSSLSLNEICRPFNDALGQCQSEVTRVCKVRVGHVEGDEQMRLGLFATESIGSGEVAVSVPFDDRFVLTADLARSIILDDESASDQIKGVAPFEGWTGDSGLIALLLLHEVAVACAESKKSPAPRKKRTRPAEIDRFMAAWIAALPTFSELQNLHPLLWSEDDQDLLQASSSQKVYRRLDDLEVSPRALLDTPKPMLTFHFYSPFQISPTRAG